MAREIFIRRINRNLPRKEFVFAVNCCVSGYHIFRSFWDAPIGSISSAKHQDDPRSLVHDKYAAALINSESVTVGHLPKFMSKLVHFFVKHAGKTRRAITGSKRYFSDLEQGGFGDSSKNIISEFNRKNN